MGNKIHWNNSDGPNRPWCCQSGNTIITKEKEKVTCIKCGAECKGFI